MAQVIPSSVIEEWPEAQDVLRLAKLISKEEVQLFYQIAITSRSDLLLAPEEETGFMMALLRMLAFMPDDGQPNTQRPQAATTPTQGSQNISTTSSASSLDLKARPSNQIAAPSMEATTQLEISAESWREVVLRLGLKGLEGQFALQTALTHQQDKSGTKYLKLATDIPQLATASSIQKLSDALQNYLKMPVKITLEENAAVVTVAHLEAKDQAIAKTELEKTVSVDPFLEQLKQEIGVTVVQGSIRPLPTDNT
jgi:DNA polymerase-3 subunit gamma/tau